MSGWWPHGLGLFGHMVSQPFLKAIIIPRQLTPEVQQRYEIIIGGLRPSLKLSRLMPAGGHLRGVGRKVKPRWEGMHWCRRFAIYRSMLYHFLGANMAMERDSRI